MQYYGLEDLGNPEHPSQDDMYCVGRICPEGDTVRLTETSLHFESSRRYGGGMRVPLRFDPDIVVRYSDDPTYSSGEGGTGLFPGMIVGIKGRNPGGGFFTASEILLVSCHPSVTHCPKVLLLFANIGTSYRQWINLKLLSPSSSNISMEARNWMENL